MRNDISVQLAPWYVPLFIVSEAYYLLTLLD
jgi:hypothetical protein